MILLHWFDLLSRLNNYAGLFYYTGSFTTQDHFTTPVWFAIIADLLHWIDLLPLVDLV